MRRWLRALSVLPAIAVGACSTQDSSGDPTNDGSSVDATDDVVVTPDVFDEATPTDASDASDVTGDIALDAPARTPGLRAEYYVGYMDLALERIEPTLDQDWKSAGAPSAKVGHDRFSARWTGFLVAPKTGRYQLAIDSDDGVRVWVDGKRVIDDWVGHFVKRDVATVDLVAGAPTAIRVEYFQLDLDASLRLSWSTAGLAEEVVPTKSLLAADAPSGMRGPKPPYTNPVIASDCPDPGVIAVPSGGGTDYDLVCTGGSFPIRTSRGLVFWKDTGASILPSGKPSWAANGSRNWAPEIHHVGGEYVAYFTTVNGADVLSIGAAHSANVLGPYVDLGHALVEDPLGVIDATFFEDDDGSRWLFYKIDGNARGKPTPIFVRRLAPDGLSFAAGSTPVQVLVNDPTTWEGGVIEAPWVVKRGGYYYLFYSGNVYDYRYRTGVARSKKIDATFEKHGAPLLINDAAWVGPGHGSVVTVNSMDYWVYHAWKNAGDGTNGAGRFVLIDAIAWAGGWPTIDGGTPSSTPRPWPGETE